MTYFAVAYIIVLGVLSLAAFVAYGFDKQRNDADAVEETR